ncbi:PH domain-containing protein [Croceicoccus ponticola]|nr:PH domain-containing protein [Croceicoccus ponticola]
MLVGTITQLRRAILPVVALSFGASTRDVGTGIVLAAALLAIFVLPPLGAFLQWHFTRYRTGAEDIRIERGVLSREARSIPYERIQDVSMSETLFSRLFGLVEVRFETGSGGKDDLTLSYVTRPEGQRLRDLVRERRDDVPTGACSGAQESESDSEGVPIFTMALPRVLLSGVFSFSLVIFAVLFAIVDQFDFLMPFDIWDKDVWEQLASEQGARIQSLGRLAQFWGALVAVIMLVLVGIASGVAKTLLRDYGFRLDRTAKGFRRRRGLLSRTDVVMPAHRVQAIATETGVIRRLFGWHSLSFVSLASDGAKASHEVAPFAKLNEIARIAAEAGIPLPADGIAWHRTSPRFWIDRAAFWLLAGTVAAIVATWLGQPLSAVAIVCVGLILAGLSLPGYLQHRHATEGGRIQGRAGLLAPHVMIAPQVRLQSAELRQGPIARLRGYAALHFGLPGGRLSFRGLPTDEALALRAAVLARIDAVDYSDLPR